MLAEAREAAAAAGVSVEWIRADAVDYRAREAFDAAICLCEGSFGLLGGGDDPLTHETLILNNIFAALKPGARFILTALNACRIIRAATPEDTASGRFDPHTLTERPDVELKPAEGDQVLQARERSFVPTELVLLFRYAGFEVLHVWGGTAGNWGRRPLELDEFEIMVVAQRPAAAEGIQACC
jgi:hypothetical protein